MLDLSNWCELPTKYGKFRMYDTGTEKVRLIVFGAIEELKAPVLLRMHSSCMASEVFGALDCDCADQLDEAMRRISEEKSGMVIHLQQEGRGHGLSRKIKAVSLMQTEEIDTAQSFDELNLEYDIRDYSEALRILKAAAISDVKLITNNPRKIDFLEKNDIKVSLVVGTSPIIREENRDYLISKNLKMQHTIKLPSLV